MDIQKNAEPATAVPETVTPEVAAVSAPAPADTPAIEAVAAETPAVEFKAEAEPTIAPNAEIRTEPRIEDRIEPTLDSSFQFSADSLKAEPAAAEPRTRTAALASVLAWKGKLPKYAPLAASIALAVVLGAVAGAAATGAFKPTAPAPVASKPATVATSETRALKETVVRLSTELATVKASLDSANRSTAAQLGKLSDRFERAEKAQAEPAARLAKIAESLERLERRAPAAAPAPVATLPPPEVTGSVSVIEKNQNAQAPVIEGWKLREFFAGRAVIEGRNGGLYEVGPGSNLPGIGRVESIRRQDGRVIVVTSKGIITASLAETRRPPAYGMPYRY